MKTRAPLPFGQRAHFRVTLITALLFGCAFASLQAQTPTSWIPGNGNWFDAAKWTNGIPNSASADVYIDNQPGTNSIVTLSGTAHVELGRLRIDAGDTVAFDSNATGSVLVSSSAFAGAGELLLNGVLSIPSSAGNGGTAQGMDGTKTINGSGKLVLGMSAAIRPEITGITNNNATIEGAAFFGRPTNPSYPGTINNTGMINANIPGAPLRIYSAANSTNSGVMKATNGAVLDFNQGDITNTGALAKIAADGPNSIATFGGFSVVGGHLEATNGGLLESRGGAQWKDLTISGPTTVASTLFFDGTITNNGIMTVPNGASIWRPSDGSVTISGSGQIVLEGAQDNLPELIDQGVQQWLIQGQTIRGRGNVGYPSSQGSIDRVSVTNQGTFQADRNGEMLHINLHSLDNQNGGLLRAIGTGMPAPALGGILRLDMNLPLKNTGGTIEAVNGGRVEAGFARIEGGVIRNLGGFIPLNGMTIVNPTGAGTNPPLSLNPEGMILEGTLELGSTNTHLSASLVGEIKNTGKLHIASAAGTAVFRISEHGRETVNLTGNGEVILGTFADSTLGNDGAGIFEQVDVSLSSRTLNNVNNTIHGFGKIGSSQIAYGYLGMKNTGVIAADVLDKTLRLELAGTDNKLGTLRASNGGIFLYGGGGIDNVGGKLEAYDNSSFSFFGSPSITGGTLRNVGVPANATNFDLGNATLVNPGSGLTLQGPFVVNAGKTALLVNSIRNEGSIRLRGPNQDAILRIGRAGSPTTVMTGGGELILGDPALGGIGGWIGADINGTAVTLTLGGPGGAAEGQKLYGFGVVGAFAANFNRYLSVINNTGTASGPTPIAGIEANVSGKELKFITVTLTNPAGKLMKATNGGRLSLWNANLINTDAFIVAGPASTVELGPLGPVTGGFVSSDVGGTIKVPQNATANGGLLFTNAGTMEFGVTGGDTFSGLANGGSSIISSGTITKVGASDYSVFSPLNSTGAINVESGILRWKAEGMIAGATSSVAANSNLYFQDAPFTFSGVNALSGPGNHGFANNTITLADAATTLNATNLNLGNTGATVLTGPGTVNISGALRPGPSTTTFSGTHLITLAGSSSTFNTGGTPLRFANAGTWENRGLTTSANINTIEGEAGTLFTNTSAGILRATDAPEHILNIPFENHGLFEVLIGRLQLTKNGTFKNGSSATIATPWEMWLRSISLAFEGTSNVTGFGIMRVDTSSLAFASGAMLNADRIVFSGNSSATGGELNVSKVLRFEPNGLTQTMSGTQINLAADVLGSISLAGGTLRLQDGAHLTNSGDLTVVAPGASALTTDRPAWTAEGSETIKTLPDSKLRFSVSGTMSWPFDFSGEIYADNAAQVTFDKGGLFNGTAKLTPVSASPAAELRFVGSGNTYFARGRGNELGGEGYVTFIDTKLRFEDIDPNLADDNPQILGTARVAFHGNNTVEGNHNNSSGAGSGHLITGGFAFEQGNFTANAVELVAAEGSVSTWNAPTGTLTLTNGATFVNSGIFTVVTPVANWSGPTGTTVFRNRSNGRFVHDTNSITNVNIDFVNEGVLEFKKGTINFNQQFSGNGGLAASSGAKVTLSLVGVPAGLHPLSFEVNGAGSQISVNLGPGQSLSAAATLNGGSMVAAGGLNMVAAGGLNLVAAGGGNLVAAGGMNLVAAGGGNISATGINTLISTQGGDIIGLDGGTLIGNDGSTLAALNGGDLIGNHGSTLIGNDGSTLKTEGGGSLIGNDGSTLIGNDGSTLIGLDGGSLIGNDGSTLIGNDGSTLVAMGGGNVAIGSGTGGRSARTGMARARAGLAVSGTKALLTTTSGANVKAIGGGSIIAHANGVIMGSGTFTGPGLIENGGALVPGNSAGTLTWTGNLAIENGGVLEVEIAGATVGTQYDRVNVSGMFTMNGSLSVRMLNGFGSNVQPTDVFDIVVAGSPISTGLAGTRVSAAGSYGSFAVALANGGTTLRLTDFQAVAPTFSNWTSRYNLTGADADPLADPNFNGIPNLVEYALGLDPTVGGSTGITSGLLEENGQKYQTLSYTKPTGAEAPTDILYAPERATSVTQANWSSSVVDIVPVGTVPGPGNLETVTVRSTHPISGTQKEFLRLRVTLSP